MEPSDLMQLAIDKCREGIAAGQSPFGCAIAVGDRVLAATHNVVVMTTDITAHAEIAAIRQGLPRAGRHLPRAGDRRLDLRAVPDVHGRPALGAGRGGSTTAPRSPTRQRPVFNELHLPAADLLRQGRSEVKLIPGLLSDKCHELFDEWLNNPNRHPY